MKIASENWFQRRAALIASALFVLILSLFAAAVHDQARSTSDASESLRLGEKWAQSRPSRHVMQANCTFAGFRSSNCARVQTAALLLD
jgi:hypothetical protein